MFILQYGFVTPLTSLVVTKPEIEKRESGSNTIGTSESEETDGKYCVAINMAVLLVTRKCKSKGSISELLIIKRYVHIFQ